MSFVSCPGFMFGKKQNLGEEVGFLGGDKTR